MKQSNSNLKKYPTKKYPTIGVCGLDCGLCPRYYTVGSSRCPGCAGPDFFNKHPSCSFITCCVKKKNLEVCAKCFEFPCSKFKSDAEYQQLKESSSYPSYKRVMPNLNFIKEYGIEKFVEQQKKRIKLLEIMIENFDDGRSRSFFCKASALLDLTSLKSSIDKAIQKIRTGKIKQNDVKYNAKILKEILKGSFSVDAKGGAKNPKNFEEAKKLGSLVAKTLIKRKEKNKKVKHKKLKKRGCKQK